MTGQQKCSECERLKRENADLLREVDLLQSNATKLQENWDQARAHSDHVHRLYLNAQNHITFLIQEIGKIRDDMKAILSKGGE